MNDISLIRRTRENRKIVIGSTEEIKGNFENLRESMEGIKGIINKRRGSLRQTTQWHWIHAARCVRQ
jgi:hypothetical protein